MWNLITDVAGVRVGHAQDARVVSGLTAVLFDGPVRAAKVIGGGAPGSRDTELLEPDMTVEGPHAVVLSGGSVYGLDGAGGVVSYLRTQGVGLAVGGCTVPIAVQAICFDLHNGGNKDWGRLPPYWEMGWQAAAAAQQGDFALGSVGGGFGASTANLKGGLGSASALLGSGVTVGALVIVNALGSVTLGDGPHFWAAPYEIGAEFGGHGLPAGIDRSDLLLRTKSGGPPSTTLALVATDADLTPAEVKRLAIMANDGLAKSIRPVHAPMDGDTVFAVATNKVAPDPARANLLTELGTVAGDCLARAVARAVFEATVPGPLWTGPPAYRDVHG